MGFPVHQHAQSHSKWLPVTVQTKQLDDTAHDGECQAQLKHADTDAVSNMPTMRTCTLVLLAISHVFHASCTSQVFGHRTAIFVLARKLQQQRLENHNGMQSAKHFAKRLPRYLVTIEAKKGKDPTTYPGYISRLKAHY